MNVANGAANSGGTPPDQKLLLGQVLKTLELVTEPQIQEALSIQRREGDLIGQILFKLGYVAKEEILLALAFQQGAEIVYLEDIDLNDIPRGDTEGL